jgi:outer membrane receptor protein involved in Fe transport
LPEPSTVDKSFGLNTPVDISIWTLKTDVEKKIKKSVLSFGFKFSNVLTDNEFTLFNRIGGLNEKDLNQSSKFSYLERVGAGYASFRHIFNDKWSVLGGLRYEHTYSMGDLKTELGVDSLVKREYGNFFPSAGVTYNLNKKHSFSFNYSRRVDRPVYRFLNPFQYRLDELSFEQGNPFLNPQFTNNFQLSHTFMSMVSSSLSYSHTTDFFARVIDSSGNRTFLTRRNLADVKTISFNLSSPIPIRNWWNGFLNFTFNHQDYEADFGEGKILRLPVDFYSIYMQHSFSLPEKISLQVSGSYSSPNVWGGTFRNRAFWFVEAGISKKVLNLFFEHLQHAPSN